MSYNILKKNVKFSGPVSGTIEGMVDTSTDQTIGGHKTFGHTVTSSAGVMLSGSGKVSASFFYGNGKYLTSVSAAPAGINGRIQFSNGTAVIASNNLSFFTSSNKLEVLGEISASTDISASAFHGNGSNLTFVTASFVTASSISGLVEANQIKKAPGLSNDAGFLTIDRANNGGIVESFGLKVELGDLSGYSATFSQNQIMIISGSGIGNRSVTLGWLGDNLLTNATNIDAGTLNNARLDQNIARQTFSASVGISSSFFEGDGSGLTNVPCGPGGSDTEIQFNNAGTIDGSPDLTFANNSLISTTASFSKISSSLVPDANNTFYLGAQDLSSRWASVNSVGANFSGLAVIATGAVSQRLGVGTLNPTNELEVTGNTVVVGQISASAGITGSAFYGDGTTLTGVPFTTSPATSNIVFVADGAAQTLNSNGNLQWTGTKLATTNITASSNIEVGGFVSASSYAFADGTLIDSAGNFQGNNASFNEITASSVISSSAQISASSFHGDGSALTNLPAPQYRYHYLDCRPESIGTSPINAGFFNLSTSQRVDRQNENSRWVAPASGSIARIIVAPSDVGITAALSNNKFISTDTPIFFVSINNSTLGYADSRLLTTTGSSANFKAINYVTNDGTISLNRMVFDLENNNPVVSGSNSFDPGDILNFQLLNTRTTSDPTVTIVFKLQETGVTYP